MESGGSLRYRAGSSLLMVTSALLVASAAVVAQAPAKALSLVVDVHAYAAQRDRFNPDRGSPIPRLGAGVVIGSRGDTLFIATARHVVDGADSLTVTLYDPDAGRAGRSVVARVITQHRALDVALIAAAVPSAIATRVAESFDRLGNAGALSIGDPVYPVGCPDGVCWGFPSPADQVLTSAPLLVLFQSTFVKGGNSGGGLFNRWWEVAGMVVRNDVPRAEAIPIEAVMEVADSVGVGSRLQRRLAPRSVPRSGYPITVSVDWLLPIGAPQITSEAGIPLAPYLESRFPSGRISLSRRFGRRLNWHAGFLRLAPDNLSISAGMVGLGMELARDRLLLRPFVEAGMSRVKARFDVGGYFVQDGSNERYVPIWHREEQDGIGFGGGASLELTVLPRMILEVTGAGWSFGRPENAPDMPHFYVGAGLRAGF